MREAYAETRARDRTNRPRTLAAVQATARRAWALDRLPVMTHKEDAACCISRRDDQGRLPIGFCGPDCIRRPERDVRARLR